MVVEARHSTGDKWTETREIRKVIEHLYFEVDYEYMTDFFLVYRLFMKPGRDTVEHIMSSDENCCDGRRKGAYNMHSYLCFYSSLDYELFC